MKSNKLYVLVLGLLLLALVLSVSPAMAQGPPDGKGPGGSNGGGGPPDGTPGGGPPTGEMVDVYGFAYWGYVRTDPDTGEEIWAWRLSSEKGVPEPDDPILDFGPEGYCPDPCLTGELITDQLNGTEPVTIRIGKNVVGTFRWSDDQLTTILAQTDPDGPARLISGLEWIPLTPAVEPTDYGRPWDGKWVRAFGRAGETDYAVLVWELRYNWLTNGYGNWYWWRTTGQPWAKMWLLDCATPGEE